MVVVVVVVAVVVVVVGGAAAAAALHIPSLIAFNKIRQPPFFVFCV